MSQNNIESRENTQRIDKWLWTVRIYKTRSLAAEECKKGRVLIDGIPVKPSRIVKVGEMVTVRKMPVIYTYEVLDIPSSRLPAKRVEEFMRNLTPEEELAKLDMNRMAASIQRDRGTGRPTKKERLILDKLKGK
jgi:ribosome-associated heat shock protein Hsp15